VDEDVTNYFGRRRRGCESTINLSVLAEARFFVLQARDGLEAMDLMREFRVDIVLSDLRMPRMDGIALTRHILSKVPNTPVLLMTAYATQDVKGLSELGVPVLNKPFMLDQLSSEIQTVLSSREISG
jgi:two-component system response regulator YesN